MRRPDQARGKGAPHGGGSLGEGLEKAEVPKGGGMDGGPPAETHVPGDQRRDLELRMGRFWALCEVWCPPASLCTAPRPCAEVSEQLGPPVHA